MLQEAFEPFGKVQHIKVIRDKGVAYVKFDKASSGALAMENLNGAVLNHGRGPKVKVLLAESPNARNSPQTQRQLDLELAFDPDNVPPRSRLFLVVPKTADARAIKEDVSKYPDLEYCKTDLIASKGVVFCKYSKASAALKAMEDICETGTLCGYKVKCMLAEPKSKHPRLDGLVHGGFAPSVQTQLDFSMGGLHLSAPHTGRSVHGDFRIPASPSAISGYGGYTPYADAAHGGLTQMPAYSDYGGLNTVVQGLSGLTTLGGSLAGMGVTNLSTMAGLTGKMDAVNLTPQGTTAGLGGLGGMRINPAATVDNSPGISSHGGMGDYTAVNAGLSPSSNPPALSKQRLFVVVYKGVKEEELARLFRRFPGMEYCDLKKDKKTAKSKGYCYVNYSTHESAKAAIQNLNGLEYPTHSGHRMKVMFAEPLGVKSAAHSPRGCGIMCSAPFTGTPVSGCERRFQAPGHNSPSGDLAVVGYDENDSNTPSGVATYFENEAADDTKVFACLTRPLPDYAIQHVFSNYGTVEYVRLQKDSRFSVVKMSAADAAQNAVQTLNGSDICGVALKVSMNPIHPSNVPE